jgi:GWxTD domain-containing protein
MPTHRVLLLALGALALARAARAQEPGERATLDSIRASVQTFADSGALAGYERQRISVARQDRDNPLIHMELGYVAFHLAELTGVKKHYQDAASEFQWATDLRPAWPYTWYNLGLAELASGEADLIIVENLRQLMGQDALSQAVRSFARAVEADPTFSIALVDLANAAMRQRIAPRLVVAQAALRRAAGTSAGRAPGVQLVRGRIERRLLDNDSAIAAFHGYLSAGGDSAIGGVELARTFALKAMAESTMAAYFAAAGRPVSDTARREIRKDLRWFATAVELATYDTVRADSLGTWLRRFWIGRDLSDGRRPGERMVEQFRRYQYAVQNFSLPSRHRGFDVAFAFRDTSQQDFDDRGVIYMRHGAPTERSSYQAAGYEPNESWLYRRDPPEGDLVVHFAAFNDVQDYRLVQSLLSVCTRRFSSDPLLPSVVGQVALWRECVQSRSRFSPEYERLARLTETATPNVWASERAASMAMVHEATTTDSYHLAFETQLRPVVSLFAVADSGLRPELHLVFAVPASRLHPRDSEGASAYPLALRMLVFDSTNHLIAAIDTLRVFRSASRLSPGTFLTEQLVVRVPPGRFHFSFVIQEPGISAGDAVSNHQLEIPRLDGSFAVSDIILGRLGSGLVWRRPEGEVPLNPLMRFPRDGEASIYYELYGLPEGAQIGTRVRIVRSGGRSIFRRVFGGGGGADLSYVTVVDSPLRMHVRQSLGLRGLSPGRYRLRLELTDPLTGRTLVRESPFEIEGGRSS